MILYHPSPSGRIGIDAEKVYSTFGNQRPFRSLGLTPLAHFDAFEARPKTKLGWALVRAMLLPYARFTGIDLTTGRARFELVHAFKAKRGRGARRKR